MNISILCVGKLKESFFREAVEEYKKRLSRFVNITVTEIPDQKIPDKASKKIEESVLEKEGEMLLDKIKNDSLVIAMCIEGKAVSSEELAELISEKSMNFSNICFVIGGSLGLSEAVKKRADLRVSFGKITLPHQLMRVVLCEQIYRAFKINANESYHK